MATVSAVSSHQPFALCMTSWPGAADTKKIAGASPLVRVAASGVAQNAGKILPGEEDFQSMKTSLTRHLQQAQGKGSHTQHSGGQESQHRHKGRSASHGLEEVLKNMCRCGCLLGDVGLEHCHAQHATDTTRHHEHMCKLTATHH